MNRILMMFTAILVVYTMFCLGLAACGSATTTAAQKASAPVHILPEADAAFTADFNSQGMGVCSEGDFSLTIEWESATGRTKVAQFVHRGQSGPAGYAIGRNSDGWFVERMAEEDAARRYPLPFAKCRRPDGLRAPAPSKVLWREGQVLSNVPTPDVPTPDAPIPVEMDAAMPNDVADAGPMDASTRD